MKTRDKVLIVKSRYSDVSHGTTGMIVALMPGGYAVEIKGRFSDATGKVSEETRCIFFEEDEIALAQQAFK